MKISIEKKGINLTIKEEELKALIFSIAGESVIQCVKEYPKHMTEKGIVGCTEMRLVKIVDDIKRVFKESSDNDYILHEINEGKQTLEITTEEILEKSIYQRTKYLGLVIYATILRKIEEKEEQDNSEQAKIATEILDEFVKNLQQSAVIILYGVEQQNTKQTD